MATIGKEPATERARPASSGSGSGSGRGTPPSSGRPRFIDRQRENIRNIMSELAKVTWPTREETRNLTIVVIGISAVLGTVLATLDALFSILYRIVNP
jgi:preprotein translocase subunit SecE